MGREDGLPGNEINGSESRLAGELYQQAREPVYRGILSTNQRAGWPGSRTDGEGKVLELRDIKGLGAARLEALGGAGITTVRDLLLALPAGYKDTVHTVPVSELRPGQEACVEGWLKGTPKLARFSGKTMVTAVLEDDTGSVQLRWFNQPWMKDQLSREGPLLLYGRCGAYQGKKTMISPSVERERALVPRYRTPASIPQKTYAGFVRAALEHAGEVLSETLADQTLLRNGLMGLEAAVRQAHRPADQALLAQARRRFAFEDLLLYQAAVSAVMSTGRKGVPLSFPDGEADRYWESLPFPPTNAQRRVLSQIGEDLRKDKPMSRMVQGDVGCGKTAIAFGAVYLAFRAGCQTALMAPTEILARQHLESAEKTLAPLGVRCGLLTGHLKAKERAQALESIRNGEWDLVIGTHALISRDVEYARLGLIVTDEQHRFGVTQRRTLALKAEEEPHTLVMSATPIPRSLALVMYGDLELSVVDELPPGRTPVSTRIVPEDKREGLYRFICEEAQQGRQTYIVCPLVEESDALDVPSAQETYAFLCGGPLKTLRLGLTYGSQKQEEKERTIAAFAAGELDVLVSTTVIEVGVNVPSATVMVIESADRFGLSQLHQLRGRVGRGADRSWCFLMAAKNERLEALVRTNDGFEIAQEDLRQRGPGEMLGTRQHGVPLLKSLKEGYDVRLIEQAREEWKLLCREENAQDRRKTEQSARQMVERLTESVALN